MRNLVLVVMLVILATIMVAPVSFARPMSPLDPRYKYEAQKRDRVAEMRRENRERQLGRSYGRDYDIEEDCDRSYGRNSTARRDRSDFTVGARTKIGGTVIDLGFINQVVKQSRNSSKPTVVVVKEPVQTTQSAPTVVEPIKTEVVRYSVVKDKTNEPVGALEFAKATDLQKVLAVGNHVKYSRGGSFLAEYEIVSVLGQFIYVNALSESGGKPQGNDDFTIIAAQ